MKGDNDLLRQIADINMDDYFEDEEPVSKEKVPETGDKTPKKERKTPKEQRKPRPEKEPGRLVVTTSDPCIRIPKSTMQKLLLFKNALLLVSGRPVPFYEIIERFLSEDSALISKEVRNMYSLMLQSLLKSDSGE